MGYYRATFRNVQGDLFTLDYKADNDASAAQAASEKGRNLAIDVVKVKLLHLGEQREVGRLMPGEVR